MDSVGDAGARFVAGSAHSIIGHPPPTALPGPPPMKPVTIERVCVYCGSAMGARPAYRDAATQLGGLIATRGLELVYGGGHVGLMGAVADGALAAGGRVTGVIPQA